MRQQGHLVECRIGRLDRAHAVLEEIPFVRGQFTFWCWRALILCTLRSSCPTLGSLCVVSLLFIRFFTLFDAFYHRLSSLVRLGLILLQNLLCQLLRTIPGTILVLFKEDPCTFLLCRSVCILQSRRGRGGRGLRLGGRGKQGLSLGLMGGRLQPRFLQRGRGHTVGLFRSRLTARRSREFVRGIAVRGRRVPVYGAIGLHQRRPLAFRGRDGRMVIFQTGIRQLALHGGRVRERDRDGWSKGKGINNTIRSGECVQGRDARG